MSLWISKADIGQPRFASLHYQNRKPGVKNKQHRIIFMESPLEEAVAAPPAKETEVVEGSKEALPKKRKTMAEPVCAQRRRPLHHVSNCQARCVASF